MEGQEVTAEYLRRVRQLNTMAVKLSTMQLAEIVTACQQNLGAPMGVLVCLDRELRDELEVLMLSGRGRMLVCHVMDEIREQRTGGE
jgi:hypothetical protein